MFLLVPAHLGSPGQLCVCMIQFIKNFTLPDTCLSSQRSLPVPLATCWTFITDGLILASLSVVNIQLRDSCCTHAAFNG